MDISERCRNYEKMFPLCPSNTKKNKKGWTKFKQYSTPDTLRRQAKMFWNFGVSREIRYELNCRKDNKTAMILTWDPTPMSQATVDSANSGGYRITHHAKAYDTVAGQTKLFYDKDGTGRCFMLDEPNEYKNKIEVTTTNLAEISEQYGKDVDIVKLDIEGRWYEMLTEMINIGISPKIILCECEMDLGDVDTNFSKLDHIVSKYQKLDYKVWTNRINTKSNIELIFQKI